MTIKLQKLTSYNLKEGVYVGRITDHEVRKNPGKNSGDSVRFRYEFSNPENKNVKYVGCNQYDLSDEAHADSLTREIQDLLGDRIWDLVDKRGNFDLDNLTDEECEVVVARCEECAKPTVETFGPIGMFSDN